MLGEREEGREEARGGEGRLLAPTVLAIVQRSSKGLSRTGYYFRPLGNKKSHIFDVNRRHFREYLQIMLLYKYVLCITGNLCDL